MSFGGGGMHTEEARVGSLTISQSAYGGAIPRIWGSARVPGNLLWYGDFQAIANTESQSSGGKGGSPEMTNTTYTYRAAFAIAVCSGTIAGVPRVFADKKQFTPAQLGFEIKTGALGQAPWSHLTANHPSEARGYSGIAYLAATAFDLGRDTSAPNLGFEIQGERMQANGDALAHEVISDILTDPVEGIGFGAARLGSMSDYAAWCAAMDLTVAVEATTQQPARQVLQDVLDATLSDAVWSQGVLKIVPYGDEAVGAWTPNTTPAYDITEADLLEEPEIERKQTSEANNRVTLTYKDREQDYRDVPLVRDDVAAVTQFGPRSISKTLTCIKRASMAATVVEFKLARELYIRNTFSIRLDERFCLLEPMDLVTLTFGPQGLSQLVARVVEIEESEDGEISVKLEEWPFGTAKPAQIPAQTGAGYVPNLNVAPGNANTPVIFEPPISLAGGSQIWMASSGGDNWGGADVWVSLDDATYSKIGTITAPARHGITTAALPLGGDPDNINPLRVDMSASRAQLMPATAAERDLYQSLMWVAGSGGGELVAYQGAALTAANRYDLTNLRRGAYGTTIAAHSIGAQVVRCDQAVFRYAYEPQLVGKTIYVKLQSRNRFGGGAQDLADVTPTTYTVMGAPLGSVTGLMLERPFTGRVAAWKWDKYPGAGRYTYTVRLYNAGTLKRTITGLADPRFEISVDQARADGLSRSIEIRVTAVSDTGASSSEAVLVSTNPQEAAVAVAAYNYGSTILASLNTSTEADHDHSDIWVSQNPAFAPASNAPNYSGPNPVQPIDGLTVGTWYLWACHVDAWGSDGRNITGPITVSVVGEASGVQRVPNASTITAAPNSDPPGGEAFWAVYSNADGKMWRWNKAAGAYTKAADGGDLTAASVTTDKLFVSQLSALSANLGSIDAGVVSIGSDGGSGWGVLRSHTHWWQGAGNGWAFGAISNGSTFWDLRAGNNVIRGATWGQFLIQAADAAGNIKMRLDPDNGTFYFKGAVMGGAYTGWAWPAAGGGGWYIGDNGILVGNPNGGPTGSTKYLHVNGLNGDIYTNMDLYGCNGTFGTITAGLLRNSTNTVSINLNATGAAKVIDINGQWKAYADGKIESLYYVAAGGALVGQIGTGPKTVYIDTGITIPWADQNQQKYLGNWDVGATGIGGNVGNGQYFMAITIDCLFIAAVSAASNGWWNPFSGARLVLKITGSLHSSADLNSIVTNADVYVHSLGWRVLRVT